jgi:hypothetical protein
MNSTSPYNTDISDISRERWREYVFSNDFSYKIENPITVCVHKENRIHKVVDKSNILHCIQPGWKILRWEQITNG